MQTQARQQRPQFSGYDLAFGGPGIHPVQFIGLLLHLCLIEHLVEGDQLALGLVDFSSPVAMKDLAEGVLELCHVTGSGLPGRGCAEQYAVPVLLKQAFAVIVPGGVEHSSAVSRLPVADKTLDVAQCGVVVWIDASPIADSG